MLGNQAESPAPRFVGKLTQLSASWFCISRLDLDLAWFQSCFELAAHATHCHGALECRPDGALCVVKMMLCGSEVSGGQCDIETDRRIVALCRKNRGLFKDVCSLGGFARLNDLSCFLNRSSPGPPKTLSGAPFFNTHACYRQLSANQERGDFPSYCSFAYSALASFRMGMSGSESFHSVRKSSYAVFALTASPAIARARPI